MGHQNCSICSSAPLAVLTALNDALTKRTKTLRVLAKESGYSRATLSRHSRKCIARSAVEENLRLRFDPRVDRLKVLWPGDNPKPEDGPNVYYLKVVYEDPPPARVINAAKIATSSQSQAETDPNEPLH
jgi:hypothetical protein